MGGVRVGVCGIVFFFQAEDGIRDHCVTGVQTCALPIFDLNERSAKELLTADFKEFTVRDTRFAIGTVETASPSAIEKRSQELLQTMRQLAHEHNYASFLFMIVDIITLRASVLISGAEHAVAEALGVPLESDGHATVVEGLVSRKKQLVPLLHAYRLLSSQYHNFVTVVAQRSLPSSLN